MWYCAHTERPIPSRSEKKRGEFITKFSMVLVVEIKDPSGAIVASHEGNISGEGDVARIVGEAVAKFRNENPDVPLMVLADQAGPTISIRHYFKQN